MTKKRIKQEPEANEAAIQPGSGPDDFTPVEAPAEGAAKPRARKRKEAALTVEAVGEAAPKKTARKSAGAKAAVSEQENAEAKKADAKETAGNDLAVEIPTVTEAVEAPEEAQAEVESYAEDAAEDALSAVEDDETSHNEEEANEKDTNEDGVSEDEEDVEEDEAEEAESDSDDSASGWEEKPGNPERLQKILAKAGIASRRAAEEMILAGRVQVNGKIVTELGTKAELGRDHVRVDGKLLHGAERLRYFVLNKPKGYVTTVSDPEHRPTVMQFFAGERERLYPVGRLDYLSEGLLLVTNDGELANKLTKAASGVEKTYLVKVAGAPSEEELDQLREGIVIERGRIGTGSGRVRTAPAQIRKVREGDNPWYEVILIEGRNREIRKLFEEVGHHVEKIRRVGYGPLVLDLEPGKMRELDEEEVHKLRLTAEGKLKPRRRRGPAPAQLERKAGRTVQHEKFSKGDRTPRRKTAEEAEKPRAKREDRPALYDRPDFSELSAPARKPRRDFGDRAPRGGRETGARSERDASTGQATGRRDFKPRRASFTGGQEDRPRAARFERPERSDRPGRAERPERGERPARTERPARFEHTEGRSAQKPFDRAGKSFDRDRAPGRGKPGDRPAGSGANARKPFRPANERNDFRRREREPEDFGTEPIPRTPGFRVEPVEDAPRATRPPRGESFGTARPGNRPFRAEGTKSFRKSPGRPSAGRPDSGRPAGDRPSRPFRERGDSERPRSAGSRRDNREDRGDFRPRRSFGEGSEDRPREFRPRTGGRPSSAGRSTGRPASGDRPRSAAGSARPRPFGAKPEGRAKSDKDEKGGAPRVKNRWRNSFEGKNKGRPKPKPKKES